MFKSLEFPSSAHRPLYWALFLLSLIPFCIILPIAATKLSLAIIVLWTAMIWIAIIFVRGRFHYIVLAWLALYPYCYYFFSMPRERPLFTVDRAFIGLLLIEMLVISRHAFAGTMMRDVRISAYFWFLYLTVCFVSLASHSPAHALAFYCLLTEGLVMPALLGLYALRIFPITGNLNKLHACICILMLGIAAVAGIEIFSGKNFLPWPGAVDEWVQTSDFRIIRVDGPFENSGVLCLVGTIGFFLIVYLRRLMGGSLAGSRRFLHLTGVWASLAAALLPMNRALVVALLVCACIDYFGKEALISRRTWNYILAVLFLFGAIGKLFYPGVYDDRVSRPDNVYQRIAQDLQTLEVVRDHPLVGVGFNLYHDTVVGDANYSVRFKGFEAMDFPHNSLFAVLAEEGCIGFLLYVAAQVFFVRAMWKLRKINELGWRVFLYCVLVYTIYGLDVGMAYYSDLNLFYLFTLGVLMQIQLQMHAKEFHPDGFNQ
jgi:hypothetical protein